MRRGRAPPDDAERAGAAASQPRAVGDVGASCLRSLRGEQGAARLHLAMARRYVRQAHAETERDVVVFYIDNHLRPYTGQETIRGAGACRTSACVRA